MLPDAHAVDLCYLLLSFCNWFPLLFGLFPSACTGVSSVGFSLLLAVPVILFTSVVPILLLLDTSFHGFAQFVSVLEHFKSGLCST